MDEQGLIFDDCVCSLAETFEEVCSVEEAEGPEEDCPLDDADNFEKTTLENIGAVGEDKVTLVATFDAEVETIGDDEANVSVEVLTTTCKG